MSQQIIKINDQNVVLVDGNSVVVTVQYSGGESTTGLGLRMHYDSSALTLADVSNVLTNSPIDADGTPAADSSDFDGNASTDTYIDFAWASLFGGWPGSVPQDLFTATFDVAEDFDSSMLTFSASSVAAGYELDAAPVEVKLPQIDLVVTPNPTYVDENLVAGQVIGQAESDLPDATYSIAGQPAESAVSIPQVEAASQHVYVSESTKSADGSQETVVISYNASATSTGLGLRIHYDSSALSLADVTGVLTNSPIDIDGTPAADTADFDGDASTDTYVDFAWASLFGGWPGAGEQSLATLTFDIADDATGTSGINFSASSNAAGFAFDAQSHDIVLDSEQGPISVDTNTGVITFNETADYETQDEYGFTVVATGSDGSSAQVSNVLHINDLDEIAPVITSGDTATAINENSGAGQIIYTATSDDGSATYSLAAGSDAALSIDATSGAVSLATDPDYETQDQYSFTVIATDAVGNASQQAVSLSVNDLDEIAPVITSGDTALAINENSGAGQVIYTATSDDGSATYSLAAGSDVALSIDATSGAVSLATDPDYETQDQYSFTVIATDAAGNASQQAVSLSVNDLNDAADPGDTGPIIISSDTATAIDENSGSGQAIYTAASNFSDPVTYDLVALVNIQNGAIEEHYVENADGSTTLQLFVSDTVSADYLEGLQNFDLVIEYNDAEVTTPQLSFPTEAALTVVEETVTGEIKVAGIFFPDLLNVIDSPIAELTFNFEPGVTSAEFGILDVLFGDITSSLPDSVSRYYMNRGFTIDSDTGVVTLVDNPDYEAQSTYSFTVTATDGSTSTPTHTVTLDINDLDDAAPTITSSDTVDAIDENSGAGQVVYTATADDSGDDISGGVTFSLTASSDPALTIDAITGEVTLAVDPDQDSQSQYGFALVATDAAGNQSDAVELVLNINDLDDTAPVIISGNTAVAVNENSGASQVIYTATADDSADISVGPITFALSEDSDAALSIDANTGEVTLNPDPDHEAQSSYSFTLIATDGAGNASEGQAVNLDVNNLDEVAPTITSADEVDAINENSGAGQVIYTATADDSADTSAGFSFSLTEDSDATLSIDAATGQVTLNADPNYEAQDQYNFSVVVADIAGNSTTGPTLSLQINNLDEVAPTITSGATAPAIEENTGAGQVIYTATANDTDYNGDQPVITYSLTDSGSGVFSVDADSGEVSLLIDPDYELQSEYSFTVVATDSTGNQSDSKTVTLSINDIDDFALTGQVYHWRSQALLENVTVTMHSQVSGAEVTAVTTDTNGGYAINDLAVDDIVISAERDLQAEDMGRFITSADALAALKLAVGLNPNRAGEDGQQKEVSPYQFMAADVNRSGLVTSADALEILKMAVRIPGVTEREWLFVDESEDFWDESQDALSVDRSSVSWDDDGVELSIADSTESNFVGVMLGDVNGSWSPLEGSQTVASDHFESLEDQGVAPMYQWGLESQNSDAGSDTDTDTGADAGAGSDTDAGADVDAGSDTDTDTVTPLLTSGNLVIVEEGAQGSAIYTASTNLGDVTYSITDTTSYSAVVVGSDESVVSIPEVQSATQHVFVSESTKSEDGTQETVVVSYNADDTTVTGLGLLIHYNSSAVTLTDISNVLSNDLFIAPDIDADDDTADFDNDASTDKYVIASWMSLFGSWPGAVPTDLATLTFDIAADATGSTSINFSTSSNAAGFTFAGQSHDLVLSAESSAVPPELVIDSLAGTVSLDAPANREVQSTYKFTVEATDAEGATTGVQAVTALVVDQLATSDSATYTGTDEADVFALADGSAQITSGAGADQFVVQGFAEGSHNIVDFESGVDSIDASAALMALGYTGLSTDSSVTDSTLNHMADVSAEILDLINTDDSSLDNAFGAYFDDSSSSLTIFADMDSGAGNVDIATYEINVGEGSTVEEDDLSSTLTAFIA